MNNNQLTLFGQANALNHEQALQALRRIREHTQNLPEASRANFVNQIDIALRVVERLAENAQANNTEKLFIPRGT